MKTRSLLTLLIGLATFGCLRAQSDPLPSYFKFETGFNYSRGDYGLAEDTEVYAVPASLSYETPAWTLRGTIPWLAIKGPASVIEGGGIPVRPTDDYETGFGDVVTSLAYRIARTPDRAQVTLSGRVKFPTGNEDRGLSTGETDYYAQIDVLQTFGNVTPFVTGGYRWLGRNALFQLKDGFFASGGLAIRVANGTSVGAVYEWREEIVEGSDSAQEVSLFFFRRFNERWSMNLSVMTGFTDASPDFGLNGSLAFSF